MTTPTLYYSDVLAPRKACAVARYLKSPVTFVYLDLQQGQHKDPAYLALNPNGKVPTLTDGAVRLWEADAIMCELSLRAEADLWPGDRRQIEILRWLSWSAQHFTRAGGALYFEYIIKARFGLGSADPAVVSEAQQDFRTCAAVLNEHLADRAWLVGDDLTVADFAAAITLPYAEHAHIPLDEFPAMRRWHDRLNEIEAWREPFPARAASAPPRSAAA